MTQVGKKGHGCKWRGRKMRTDEKRAAAYKSYTRGRPQKKGNRKIVMIEGMREKL